MIDMRFSDNMGTQEFKNYEKKRSKINLTVEFNHIERLADEIKTTGKVETIIDNPFKYLE
jgi:ribosome-associated toxin RatA of RatAB toxin-antitoxin module